MWGGGAKEGWQYQLLKLKLAQVRRGERGKGEGEGRGRGERGGERGEFGVAVPCATSVTFQVFHRPHQFLLFVRKVRRKETLQLELLLLGL